VRLIWSDLALDDLADIRRSIAALNPPAAERVAVAIKQSAQKLRDFPYCGRQEDDGTRTLVVVDYPSYSLIYEVSPVARETSVTILTVWKNWFPR